ncbi:MAG: UvrD-helicase domain-containing protein [Verrucomicrobia bacterium]|nr:UvrD-helicase domain-containing protein [Verrucomicrobiota bacterium]
MSAAHSESTLRPAPADQASRTHFAQRTDQNLAVCAGAGTGKTTAISARIARLVLEDARDGDDAAARLIVVTYTKAAAAELRARALAAALAAVRDPAAAGHGDIARPDALRAQKALAGLQRAFFGTIHAFCLELLLQHGVEAGIEPEYTLHDEGSIGVLAERFRQSDDAEAVAVPAELLRFVRYEEILGGDLIHVPAEPVAAPVGPPPKPNFTELFRLPESGTGKANIIKSKELARRWLAAWDAKRKFLGLPEMAGESKRVKEAHAAALAPLQAWIAAALGVVQRDLADEFARFRQREAALVFDDIIRLTRTLLLEGHVLEAVRAERRLVLLDEAQDTSREMFEILAEIVRPPGAEWGTWPADPRAPGPRPGAFSLVGDDQQSVYREKARPEDFAEYSDALVRQGGAQVDLHVTMRCDRAVVDFVNAVFADAELPIAHGGTARFRPLTSRPAAGPGRVWRLPLQRAPEADPRIADTRRAEAEGLAAWLARTGPAGLGVESWGDIAVVAPRKNWLESVESALRQRRIPVRSRAAVRIARTQPAWSWPIALLHVLAEPWDRFELIGVLRDVFGISDPDLLTAHQHGLLGFIRPPVDARLAPELAAALDALHELHQISLETGTTGVGMLDALSERLLLRGRLAAVEAAADALGVLREAAALVCHTGLPWRNWVRDQVAALERQPPELPPLADGLELIGAQKAKGLQWKVVIPVGLGQGIHEGGNAVADLRPQRDAEFRRFLYVTFTRARETLILPDTLRDFHPAPTEAAPSYAGLLPHLEACVRALPEAPRGAAQPWHDPPRVVRPEIDWETAARASRPPARRLRPADTSGSRSAPDGVEPLLEAAGGRDYGTWWHESLAAFPWRAGEEGRQVWREAALRRAPEPAIRLRGEDELRKFLGNGDVFRHVASAAQFATEVPIVHAFERPTPRWMEGVADLVLFDGKGGAIVIDWKTDRPGEREAAPEFAQRLRAMHHRQIELYATALQDGANLRVQRAFLFATATGELVECRLAPETEPRETPQPKSFVQLELF